MDITIIVLISLFIYSFWITKKWTCSDAKVRSFENKLKLKDELISFWEKEHKKLTREYLQSIAENEEIKKNVKLNNKNEA